jgi:uncharacterized protein (DUF305 family)
MLVMKKTLLALAALTVILTGCAQVYDDGMGNGGKAAAEDSNISELDYSALSESSIAGVDVVFVDMMIPHHEQALVLADLAFKYAEDSEVLRLAEEIRSVQDVEVDMMRSWYANSDIVPRSQDHSEMAGMLSYEQLEALGSLRGREFDIAWLEGMIEHHEGAIDMADMVKFSKTPAVIEFAEHLVVLQQWEIDEMRSLLETLKG